MEDLHAAEVSLEALQYVVRRLGPTPTLVLGSYRTSEVDRRHPLTRVLEGFRGDRRFAAIPLGPLLPAEHRAFVETLVGGAGLTESLAQKLYEGTEGNPFFTKELVRSLLGSGAIAADVTGQWTLSGEAALSADAMPATIQEAVEGRIQRLPEELRRAARDRLRARPQLRRARPRGAGGGRGRGRPRPPARRGLPRGATRGPRATSWRSRAGWSATCSTPRSRRASAARCTAAARRGWRSRHAGRLERVLPQLVHHYFNGDVPEKTVEHGLRLARLLARRLQRGGGGALGADGPLLPRRRVGGRPGPRGRGAPPPGAGAPHGRRHRGRPAGGGGRGRASTSGEGRTAAAAVDPALRRGDGLAGAAQRRGRPLRGEGAGGRAAGRRARRAALAPVPGGDARQPARRLRPGQGPHGRGRGDGGAPAGGGGGGGGARGRAAGGGARQPGEVDRAGHHPDERGSGGGGQRLRDAARHQPRREPDPRPVREVGASRGGPCLPSHPAARRPLLRRAAADRRRRQGLVRGLGPPGPGGAAVGLERRARGGRAPRRDVRGDRGPRGARRPRAGDPAPRAAARSSRRCLTEVSTGVMQRRPRTGALGDGAVPRRLARGRPGRPRAKPPVLAGAPGAASTRSSSARSRARTPSPRATARARWTSPGTCCPRTSRRSSATRACGGGWSRRRRRTPTSSSSTAAAVPPPPAPSCAGPSREPCAPRTSSGGRSAVSRSRRRASSRRPWSGTTPGGGAAPSPARRRSPC